jgi:hypothetical protein
LVGVCYPFGWRLLPFWLAFATLLVGVCYPFGWRLVAFWLNVNEFNIQAMKNGRFCYPFGWRLVGVWLAFGSRLVELWYTKKASHTHVQNAQTIF